MHYNGLIIENFSYKEKYGEEAIESWLSDNYLNTIDYTNLNYQNIKRIEIIENYILKNIHSLSFDRNPKVYKFVERFLNQIYIGFLEHPEIYITSPLLTDELVSKIAAPEYIGKYENKKQELLNSAWQIYQKSLKGAITDSEKDLLSNFFIKMIDTDNENLKKAIDDYANRIIRESCVETRKDGKIEFNYTPISQMNDSELRFIAFYASRFVTKNNLVRNVHIVKFEDGKTGGVNRDGIIGISKTYYKILDMDRFLSVVCHETEHAIQEKASRNENSVIALDYATDRILFHYLSSGQYNPYRDNYQYSEIEKDANEAGWYYSSLLLSTLGLQNRMSNQHERELEEEKNKQFEFSSKTNSLKQLVTLDEMQIDELRKIIKNHPELLQKYPVLKNFYNANGEEKPFNELIVEASKSSYGGETYKLFKNYLLYHFRNNSLTSLDLNKYSDEERARIYITVTKLLSDIGTQIEDHVRKSNEVLSSQDIENINDVIRKTGIAKVNVYKNLLMFIRNNYNEIKRLEDNGLIPNNILYGTLSIKSSIVGIEKISQDSVVDLPYYQELFSAQALSDETYKFICFKENMSGSIEEFDKEKDEQPHLEASTEIDANSDVFETQKNKILNSKHFTPEQKKQIIEDLYQESDEYIEVNPEKGGRKK